MSYAEAYNNVERRVKSNKKNAIQSQNPHFFADNIGLINY